MKLEQEIKQEKFKNPEQRLTINLVFTYYWLVERFKEHLQPHNISMQQFNILRILRGQGNKPSSINLLKERMLDHSSDASRLVERLRIKGLVERVICEHDRRSVEIRITEKGSETLSRIDELEVHFAEKFNALSKEEIETLGNLLDKLRG
jgi:DNA-binding MarR family transcriptional regulator